MQDISKGVKLLKKWGNAEVCIKKLIVANLRKG